MPHESTVEHVENIFDEDGSNYIASRARGMSRVESEEELGANDEVDLSPRRRRLDSLVPHLFAATPKELTHLHDDDVPSTASEEEDEEDAGSSVNREVEESLLNLQVPQFNVEEQSD